MYIIIRLQSRKKLYWTYNFQLTRLKVIIGGGGGGKEGEVRRDIGARDGEERLLTEGWDEERDTLRSGRGRDIWWKIKGELDGNGVKR